MNKLLFTLSLTLFFKLNAQITQRTCGTPILPQQFETWVQSLTPTQQGKYGSGTTQSVFHIPVIVHIIHNSEAVNATNATTGNNLNAAQIADQINILNRDYNGLNADTSSIPSIFKPVLGKFQVNFCLAVVNPTGGVMAEPGIDRVDRNVKGWTTPPYTQTYIDATIKPNSIWDPNRYLNIWVCPLGGGLLGYSTFPNPGTSGLQGLTGSFGTSTTDGVVILNTSFGSVGTAQTAPYNKGRTSTHEIGHWMGLRHVWGDGTCLTDYCNDTPPAQTANYGCPTFPHNLGVCTGNTTGEMTMNYMDYTDDGCMYMFTADQKNRAQLILTNSTMRAAIITSTVCDLPTIGNDIGITYVANPTYSMQVNCTNTINPIISLTNYGTTTLTSASLAYNVDGANTQTQNWTGSVAPNSSFTLALNTVTGLTAGAHTFSVNVSAPNGGTDNNPGNNNSVQQFVVSFTTFPFSVASGTICLGGSTILTATAATTYSRSTGAQTSTVSLNPTNTTNYTVTGAYGMCSLSKTATVTVQGAAAGLTVTPAQVCAGIPQQITASGAASYTWSSGETSASITVTLTAPAIYTLTGVSSLGCTSTQIFTISTVPAPSATVLANNLSCSNCTNATVTVNASGGTGPYTYQWQPGGSIAQTLTNVGAGCYTVTVTDANTCQAEGSACVSFDTGIFSQTLSSSLVKVSPNPSSGKFELSLAPTGLKSIEITDAFGKLIQHSETNSGSVTIDISAYPEGIYYARITTNGAYTVVKLLKK